MATRYTLCPRCLAAAANHPGWGWRSIENEYRRQYIRNHEQDNHRMTADEIPTTREVRSLIPPADPEPLFTAAAAIRADIGSAHRQDGAALDRSAERLTTRAERATLARDHLDGLAQVVYGATGGNHNVHVRPTEQIEEITTWLLTNGWEPPDVFDAITTEIGTDLS